jgi:hypothetical protein
MHYLDYHLPLHQREIMTSLVVERDGGKIMVVRFISSKQKPRLKSFSGLFTLIDSFEESTVIGCTLNPTGYTMFEVPVSSPLSFNLALNNQD